MGNKIKIACLPVAGIKNPYQFLMIEGLNSSNQINAFNGTDDRFLGIIKTVIKYKPVYLHFDWIQSYYIRRSFWMTILLLPIFILQVLHVKYFTKTKIVWTLHNIMPHDTGHLSFNRWVRYFFAKQCEWIRVFAKDSIFRATKELGIPKEKFVVVPEGDYTSVYPNSVSQEFARQELKIDINALVLLSLGYIKPYKGIEKLIHEFSKIEYKGLNLVIAGQIMDKQYYSNLQSLIHKRKDARIFLIGTFIPVEDLQIYYNAADVVVLPFDKVENSGSAIMAMGFKKPIVAPKMGVLKKRLEQQKYLLYDDLREGIKKVITFSKRELIKIGEENLKALKKDKWEDFATIFILPPINIGMRGD